MPVMRTLIKCVLNCFLTKSINLQVSSHPRRWSPGQGRGQQCLRDPSDTLNKHLRETLPFPSVRPSWLKSAEPPVRTRISCVCVTALTWTKSSVCIGLIFQKATPYFKYSLVCKYKAYREKWEGSFLFQGLSSKRLNKL